MGHARRGLSFHKSGFLQPHHPYPNLKIPDSGAQTHDEEEAGRSFRSWLGHKLTRSPTRFNSTTPGLEYEAE